MEMLEQEENNLAEVPVAEPKHLASNPAGSNSKDSEELLEQLINACLAEKEDVVKSLVTQDVNIVKLCDENERTGLMCACMRDNENVMEMLIGSGSDVNARHIDGTTVLMFSCMRGGHVRIADLLIGSGADVTVCGHRGENALMLASLYGNVQSVNLLIEKGAGVDVQDDGGKTALIHACENGHDKIVVLLIDGGCDVDVKDAEGRTALSHSFDKGFKRIAESLLDAGADGNMCDVNGKSPLMRCCENGHEEMVKLLTAGCGGAIVDVDACDKNGKSPLVYSGLAGHYAIAEHLLEACGARLDSVCKGGKPALMFSCESGDERFTEWLLSHGADVNVRDGKMKSPLMFPCKDDDDSSGRAQNVAEMLLNYGAHVDLKDENDRTALMHASKLKSAAVAEKLLDHGADVNFSDWYGKTALMIACGNRSEKVVKLLCERGADVNLKDKKGRTALMTVRLCAPILHLLLQADAEADVSGFKTTLIMTTCVTRNTNVMEMLLKHKVNREVRDLNGSTPLIVACENRFFDICELLVQGGANVNAQNKGGITALMMAIRKNARKCIDSLLGAKPNLDLVDNYGRTVFSYLLKERSQNNYFLLRNLLGVGIFLQTDGKLKDVHCNANNEIACYRRINLTINYGMFQWKWCNVFCLYTAYEVAYLTLRAKMCPGEIKCHGHYRVTASPLIISFLACEERPIATFFKHNYFYPEDYTKLINHRKLKDRLARDYRYNSLIKLYNEMTLKAFSLVTWSVLTISKSISLSGPPSTRGQRVASLPIPNKLKELLMFEPTV